MKKNTNPKRARIKARILLYNDEMFHLFVWMRLIFKILFTIQLQDS